jgi:hypothetical protein
MPSISRVRTILCAALSTLALSFFSQILLESPATAQTAVSGRLPAGLFNGWGLCWIPAAAGIYALYRRVDPLARAPHPILRIVSVLFALFTAAGVNFRFNNTLNLFSHSLPRAAFTLFAVLGLSLLLCSLFTCLLRVLSRPCAAPHRIERALFDQYAFRAPFLCIFLCTLPYLLFFYPGTVHWDALWQLNFFTGQWTFTAHHPPFSTLLMGGCLRLGQALGSDNLGVFCYVLPQAVFSALVFAATFPLLRDLHAPYPLRWAALAYFALFPLCPIFAVTLTKDTSFALSLTALSILAARLFLLPGTFTRRRAFLLFLSALLVCLTRNNGPAQIVLCLLLFLPLVKKRARSGGAWNASCAQPLRRWVACSLGSALAAALVFNQAIVPALGILPGSAAEAMSIPLQQTARTALLFPEDITAEERTAIDGVVPYDQLAGAYLPEKSDGVKSLVRPGVTSAQWSAYLRAWFSQLLRHPFTYLEATLNNTYGYLYPNRTQSLDGLGYYDIERSEGIYLGNLDLHFIPAFSQARYRLRQLAALVQSLPVAGMLYSCGLQVWILLLCAGTLVAAQKKRALGALGPSFTCVLVCLASPVNAYIRYLLPVFYALPLTAAILVFATPAVRRSAPNQPYRKKEDVPYEDGHFPGSSL